jgi:hypothetical protein
MPRTADAASGRSGALASLGPVDIASWINETITPEQLTCSLNAAVGAVGISLLAPGFHSGVSIGRFAYFVSIFSKDDFRVLKVIT